MTGILISAILENITTRKDNTLKIVLGTQEMSGGKAGELFAQMNKLIAIYFSPKEAVSDAELSQVDAINVEFKGKTQSKRIRDVLYILFMQDNQGFKDFDSYYRHETELYIETLKSNIKD